MPYEGNDYDVKLFINGEEVDWKISFDTSKQDEKESVSHEKQIAEILFTRYTAFLDAGFDKNQAFSLVRNWFNSELKDIDYDAED